MPFLSVIEHLGEKGGLRKVCSSGGYDTTWVSLPELPTSLEAVSWQADLFGRRLFVEW